MTGTPPTIQRRPLADLQLDPANVRRHPAQNIAAIKASLTRFGQQKPVVIDRRGIVVAGNGTLAAARDLGWTEIDVVVTDLAGSEAVAFAIADNRTAELAEWDDDALASVLAALKAEDDALLQVAGFSEDDLNKLVAAAAPEATQDVVPAVPAVPVTQPGDLVILGRHRLLCGDATNPEHVRLAMGDTTPFLMVTDPPYGVAYDPAWRNEEGLSDTERTGVVTNDHRVDWTDAYRLFPGDVAYVWHAGRFAADVAGHLTAVGMGIRAQIIWRKPRFAISRGHYHWQHEPCWYAVREGRTSRWVGDRSQSTVWDLDNSGRDEDATTHGTQKPVEAMARPIRNHGGPDDVVYDPFLGSGTTIVAAEQLGRACVGLEIEPGYCDVIVARWEALTGQQATREAR